MRNTGSENPVTNAAGKAQRERDREAAKNATRAAQAAGRGRRQI